jgi:hypothetical protein
VAQLVPIKAGEVPDASDRLIFATRVALGLTAIAGEGLAQLARRVVPAVPSRAPRVLGFSAGAAVGLGLEVQRRTWAAAGRVAPAFGPLGSFARARLEPWYRQGVEEQRYNRELAGRFSRLLISNLGAVVLDEVDLNAIADRIDVERVLDRMDLDRVAERLDVNVIVQRVDLPQLTRQVLEEIEVGEIIRESTSSLAGESVDALRVQGMNADRRVSRLVDRLLLRKDERRTRLDG